MSGNNMPRFEKDWYFLGFAQEDELPKLLELAKKYKCELKATDKRGAVFSNNPFRIDSIRKRLWGHRWAIHEQWVNENPDLAGFDPRAKVKPGPRAGQ